MQPTSPRTVDRVAAAVSRKRRPIAAVLLAVVAATAGTITAQPWQRHASPISTRAESRRVAPAQSESSAATGAPSKTPAPVASAPPAPAAIHVTLPAAFQVPGSTALPWPRTGQAAITLADVGDLGAHGSTTPVPVASVAKTMTAYLILRDHPLTAGSGGPTLRVTSAEAAAFRHQVALGQSLVGVRAGEALTELQALQALMLASADNVAQILGRWDAGSVPAFLAKMNATAKRLGMTHTHYTDPSGYDQGTTSTVTDQIHLADTAMKISSFVRVVSTRTAVIPVAGRISNLNALLGDGGVVGIKTGSMSAAGGCLLFAARATIANRRVTILGTVLGQRSSRIGDLHQAFASSRTLLAAVHRVLKPYTLVRAGQVVGTAAGATLVAAKDVTVVGWPGLKVTGSIDATVPPHAENGARVGTLRIGNGLAAVPVNLKA
jgi:D-alanyl-D-alanine carboxypeptidase (penicillin-binding protein 5/6)